MTEEGIYTALLAENNARCNPPLDEAEVKKIAHGISRYQPNPPGRSITTGQAAEMQKGCVTCLVKSLDIIRLLNTGWYMTAVAGGKKPENLHSLLLEQQEICSQKQAG